MTFSARTAWDIGEGALAQAIRETREAGRELIDLTISNPTLCGFSYAGEEILAALGDPAALVYDPDPRGIRSAREAVAEYYTGHAATIDPDRLLLTTSTSEAYSFLFRLLCDPGDTVLVARPSYPLFDFLADLDDVRLESYPLFYDFGWWIDFAQLERRIGPRTRAIVLVHPNNPTGHATGTAERERLEAICVREGLALIVDEVFLDYGLVDYSLGKQIESFAVGPHPCLTFVVSGLSKIAALPQMKVGWLACFGPASLSREVMARLDVVADTFLSMNAPAQLALPAWLKGREAIQRQILERVRRNLQTLTQAGLEVLPVQAGWSAVLRLPPVRAQEDLAVTLVDQAGIVVHPGSFYGMPGERWLIVSTLGAVEEFGKGIKKLAAWCESMKLT